LTLWFKLVVQREMQGECFLVNFADDCAPRRRELVA